MILALSLIGVAVFAITGALAAGRKRMDIFGVVMGLTTRLIRLAAIHRNLTLPSFHLNEEAHDPTRQ